MAARDDDDEQQRRRDEFEVERGETEAQGERHAALVENRAEHNRRRRAQETQTAQQLRADDNGSDGQHQRACAHRDIEIALILAHDAAGERDKRVGNRQAEDFDLAAVLGEAGDERGVIAGRAEEEARAGGKIRIHQHLDEQGDERHQNDRHVRLNDRRQGNNEIIFEERVEGEQLHVRAAGDMQVDRIQSRHHDDARQQVAHVEFHVDDAGQRARRRARQQRSRKRKQRMNAVGNHQRRDRCAEREGRIDRHIRKIQNFECDVHAEGQNRVNQALFEHAEQLCHIEPP